jgi:hypothetical protein
VIQTETKSREEREGSEGEKLFFPSPASRPSRDIFN